MLWKGRWRQTFEQWSEILEQRDRRFRRVLPDREFQEEDGHPDGEQHGEVGYEEGSSSILVAQVREPPQVTQPCNRKVR